MTRRTTIATMLPLAQAGAQETPGVGVIGVGNRSRAHFAALAKLPAARVVALSDVEAGKMRAVNEGLAAKASEYVDYRELLRDRNVGVVVIATPNLLHHEMAIAALRAGKDVMLEKPIALSYQEARAIQAEAKKQGRVLGIGMQRIYRSDREMVEPVRQGAIGAVRLVTTAEYRRDWFPGGWKYKGKNWRFVREAIGSSELEFSVHLFGTLCRMIDAPLKWLSATGGALEYRDRDIRDASTTIAEFANGVRWSHTYCMFAPQTPIVIVAGERGSLRREAGKLSFYDADGKPLVPPAVERGADSDEVLMYRDFFEAVRVRREPQVSADLAIEASKLAFALDLSIRENRVVTARDFPG